MTNIQPPKLDYTPLAFQISYDLKNKRTVIYRGTFEEAVKYCEEKNLGLAYTPNGFYLLLKGNSYYGKLSWTFRENVLSTSILRMPLVKIICKKWGIKLIPQFKLRELLAMDDFKREVCLANIRYEHFGK